MKNELIDITNMNDSDIALLLGMEQKAKDLYLDALFAQEEQQEKESFMFAGGYEASRGDYEGACLAKGEYQAGGINGFL